MSSKSRLPKGNGSPPLPQESLCTTPSHPPPPPTVTIAQILVTMAWNAPCTPAFPIIRQPLDMLHIIVWKPNVISVIDGNILTTYAIFRSVAEVMNEDMWWITVQSILYPSWRLKALIPDHIWRMMTSIPLWMTNERLKYVEPGAQMYEGGNVMIFFLSHISFLISVVCHSYFHFAPQYEEVDHYLLAFSPLPSPLFLPL